MTICNDENGTRQDRSPNAAAGARNDLITECAVDRNARSRGGSESRSFRCIKSRSVEASITRRMRDGHVPDETVTRAGDAFDRFAFRSERTVRYRAMFLLYLGFKTLLTRPVADGGPEQPASVSGYTKPCPACSLGRRYGGSF